MKKLLQKLLMCSLLLPALAAAGPDLVLKDLGGKERNVSEYIGQGKWTVVAIWAHNCPICNEEIPAMSFFHDAHKDKDAIVLGVSVDGWSNRAKAQGFVDTHELNFTNLIAEPRQEVLMRLGGGRFYGTPTFYIYSPSGELVARQVGPVSAEAIEEFIKGTDKNRGRAEREKSRAKG